MFQGLVGEAIEDNFFTKMHIPNNAEAFEETPAVPLNNV